MVSHEDGTFVASYYDGDVASAMPSPVDESMDYPRSTMALQGTTTYEGLYEEWGLGVDEEAATVGATVWELGTSEQGYSGLISSTWAYKVADNGRKMASTIKRESFVKAYADRLGNVYLECTDALKVIASRDHTNAFHYCDPPYYNANMGHYASMWDVLVVCSAGKRGREECGNKKGGDRGILLKYGCPTKE